MHVKYACLLLILLSTSVFLACAEGPLWKTGRLSPWVQRRWAEEDRVASTLASQKKELTDLVVSAESPSQKEMAADHLANIVNKNSILLLKIHAVDLLGNLQNEKATAALRSASRDPDKRIRIAAIRSWEKQPADLSISQLQEILGSDTDVDVRLAATSALGQLGAPQAANALRFALRDDDPAIQLKATEALAKITGQDFGPNVANWQSYLNRTANNAQGDQKEWK